MAGTVRLAPENGKKLGRGHRFGIRWDSVLGLQEGEREYKKTRSRYFAPVMDEWEAKYPAASAGTGAR